MNHMVKSDTRDAYARSLSKINGIPWSLFNGATATRNGFLHFEETGNNFTVHPLTNESLNQLEREIPRGDVYFRLCKCLLAAAVYGIRCPTASDLCIYDHHIRMYLYDQRNKQFSRPFISVYTRPLAGQQWYASLIHALKHDAKIRSRLRKVCDDWRSRVSTHKGAKFVLSNYLKRIEQIRKEFTY